MQLQNSRQVFIHKSSVYLILITLHQITDYIYICIYVYTQSVNIYLHIGALFPDFSVVVFVVLPRQ